MSIEDQIQTMVVHGRLALLAPKYSGAVVRRLYYTPEVGTLLDGPWESPPKLYWSPPMTEEEWEDQCGLLRADLEEFVTGQRMIVAEYPKQGLQPAGFADLKRLQWAIEEVWEMRTGDPPPGFRVFGRFAARDVFIALTWYLRSQLPFSDAGEDGARITKYDLEKDQLLTWDEAKNECQSKWRICVPSYPPLTAVPIEDYRQYLSNFKLDTTLGG